jgi:hypothetical protein
MEIDNRALSLTRRHTANWLAQNGTEWQLGLFTSIGETVQPDLLEQPISKALREAEPLRATFFATDGQIFQMALGYADVELAVYDLSCSRHPVKEARQTASSSQRAPMPFTGPLLKFAIFRTRPDEYFWFSCCLLCNEPIGIGVIMPSNARHSDRAPMVGGVFAPPGRPSERIEFKHAYSNHRMRRR